MSLRRLGHRFLFLLAFGTAASQAMPSASCAAAVCAPRGGGAHRFWPSKERWRQASLDALRKARTWVPAATAAAVAIGGWDRQISDWAVDRTPLFGSPHRARDASDIFRSATDLAMITTALTVPGEDAPWKSRFRRLLVEEGGTFVNDVTTLGLKRLTDRERPDESGTDSFPSGHTSRAFTSAAMTWRNLDETPMPPEARLALQAAFTALAGGTAWARVEAGVHFPSDVLAGAALGNFVGLLIHDAFLDPASPVTIEPRVARGTVAVWIRFRLPRQSDARG